MCEFFSCVSYVSGQWAVLDAIPVSSFIQPANGRVIESRVHSADKYAPDINRSGSRISRLWGSDTNFRAC